MRVFLSAMTTTPAVVVVALLVALSSERAAAQPEGPTDAMKQHGVRGHIVIAPEILTATEWPAGAERERSRATPSRIRRPAGRGVLTPAMEPVPALLIVVEGENARGENPAPAPLRLEGMRFAPGQMLLPRAGPLAIENKQSTRVTIVNKDGDKLVVIEPGQTGVARLKSGEEVITTLELPYARASVRVLERATVLPFDKAGELSLVRIDGGDYKLAFYLGAKLLLAQPIQLFDDRVTFIDATVSAKEVVVPTIKDASLRIAVPQGASAAKEAVEPYGP